MTVTGDPHLAVTAGFGGAAALDFVADPSWVAGGAGKVVQTGKAAVKGVSGARAISQAAKGAAGFADAVAAAKSGSRLAGRNVAVVGKAEVAAKGGAVATAEASFGKSVAQGAAKPPAAAVSEKALAKDMSPRVKSKMESILSTADPAQAFEAKFGKKAIQNMSDHELAQSLANRADKTALGEFGAEVGRLKHKYAERVFNRYQKMTGQRPDLVAEKRYKDGVAWDTGMGLDGSVKPDLYNTHTGIPYDYKFGKAQGNKDQIERYKKALPKTSDGSDAAMEIIKPNH